MTAWIKRRADQMRELGDERASWYCYWIDPHGRQRSKSCGPGEDGRLRAEELKAKVESEGALRLYSDTLTRRLKGMAGLSKEEIARLDGNSIVYFVEAVGLERVKIGTTSGLRDRLAMLTSYSPVRLKVLLVVSGDSDLESHFHRQFRAFRLHGEWFQMSAPVCKSIQRLKEVHRQTAIVTK